MSLNYEESIEKAAEIIARVKGMSLDDARKAVYELRGDASSARKRGDYEDDDGDRQYKRETERPPQD